MNAKTVYIALCLLTLFNACQAQADNKPQVSLDVSQVPELQQWGRDAKELAQRWHPRIKNLLASKDFEPTNSLKITIIDSDQGIAHAAGNNIVVFSDWITRHPEDIGLIVHELTHVIQAYPDGRPMWLTEGIADYIRWVIYEAKPLQWFNVPDEEHGYRHGYRVTAGFLLWLESDPAPGIVRRLNAAMRNGQYTDAVFEEHAGVSLEKLWQDYRRFRRQDST